MQGPLIAEVVAGVDVHMSCAIVGELCQGKAVDSQQSIEHNLLVLWFAWLELVVKQ